MKSIILALFAITIIIVILMPDEASSSPARFRNRNQRFGRRGRTSSVIRRGRNRSFKRNNRRGSFRIQARQGRTFPSQDVLPPPIDDKAALEATDLDYEGSGDVEEVEDEVPHWCNPSHGMGSWMNFLKLKKWCTDNGYTKLGPYGGVPAEASGEEDAAEDRSIDIGGNEVTADYVDEEYEY